MSQKYPTNTNYANTIANPALFEASSYNGFFNFFVSLGRYKAIRGFIVAFFVSFAFLCVGLYLLINGKAAFNNSSSSSVSPSPPSPSSSSSSETNKSNSSSNYQQSGMYNRLLGIIFIVIAVVVFLSSYYLMMMAQRSVGVALYEGEKGFFNDLINPKQTFAF
jgi:uncharacterized membrane protein